MSKLGVLAEPVLVGRKKELEELYSFLNSVIEGKGKTIFVSGEAGSGKTRLAREFLKAAMKKGVAVMAGWCLSDSQVPYFPFMEAFNNYYAIQVEEESAPTSLLQPHAELGLGTPARLGKTRGEMEITAWLAGKKSIGKAELLSPQAWKDQVFIAVSETLHAIAAQSPVILFIEDAHWADSASLALLHYVCRAIHDSERILLLATYRSEELTADAEGHPHPLAETLRLMHREELFTEINLPSLNQASISKMVESMLGGVLQSNLAEKLAIESKGNPLFLVESLRMLHERKSLFQENNEWRLAVDTLGIPNKIKDVILRRLACLKYTQRRVLDAASVIGEEFNVELLSTVLGQDYLEILETLNIVAHSTSLVSVEGNHYRFDHARSRETLYDELALPLKRGYHNKIAEKLERIEDEALPLSDIAYHYAQAGNKEKSLKYALAAGKDELAKWSNFDAINHFTYVLKTAERDPDHQTERTTALEGLGDAYFAYSFFKEAMTAYEDLANEAIADVIRLRAYRKAMESAFQRGDVEGLKDLVGKAEPYATADPIENARVLVNRGRISFPLQGLYQTALNDYRAALKTFEEEYSLGDIALTLLGLSNTSTLAGMWKEGLASVLRAIALFEELKDFRFLMDGYWTAGISFYRLCLGPEGLNMLRKVVEINEKMGMGDCIRLSFAYACSAWIFEQLGNFEEAQASSLKAVDFSEKTDSLKAQGMVFSNLSREYSLTGDIRRAEQYFEKLMKIPFPAFNVRAELTKAVFFAATGRWVESEDLFRERLEITEKEFNPGDQAMERLLYGWALERMGRFEEAKARFEEVDRVRQQAQEMFDHSDLRSYLMVRQHVSACEEFELRLEFVNVSRKAASLIQIRGAMFPEFKVAAVPFYVCLKNGDLELSRKSVGPFQVETIKLKLMVEKAGSYRLTPEVSYVDDLGDVKTFKLEPAIIAVGPAKQAFEVLPGRVTTGTGELDRLLLGGIPEKYAIVLTAPSSDERQQLIKRFLEAGGNNHQTTIYLTCEAGSGEELAKRFQTDFYVSVCNPQVELILPDLPNIIRLKGTENLTEIDISLTKLFRTITLAENQPRRICIDIVSDALLQHHAVTTRKWLSGLIATLKSKGLTTLAVIDPSMHAAEEANAILGLFDGEIRITEKETAKDKQQKTLKITKMLNQNYLKDELTLA